MAIPWLVVLQSVPWSDVIRNAPKVADGAKKLWNAVAGKSAVPKPPVVVPRPDSATGAGSLAALDARIVALESAVADLHAQMLASSEVIKALAEQNTQLIKRVEANRVRVAWLTAVAVLAAIVAIAGWFGR
jgi:hypothetical protein